jgi:hypothetical protein
LAVTHQVRINEGSVRGHFRAESVSFSSTAGDQNSARAVPTGQLWRLQTVRALNGEGAARTVKFKLVDPDGLTYAVLHEASAAAGDDIGWVGDVLVPAQWTIRAYFLGMAGGATCNWQYTALAVDPE